MGKCFLVVASCPVMALPGAIAVCGSTISVHLREDNSERLGCPTGGSMAPMVLGTRVTLSFCALLIAVLHPCLAVLPAGSGCC